MFSGFYVCDLCRYEGYHFNHDFFVSYTGVTYVVLEAIEH